MRVRLYCNGAETPVSPFIGRFTANVCLAAVGSLKGAAPEENLRFHLQGGRVEVFVDGNPLPLNTGRGFAATIVGDTLRGMVRSLRGIDPEGDIRIEVELKAAT